MTDTLYYAKGRDVWKAPVRTKIEGGTSVSLGFQACTATDIIGEEGAEAIAALLTLGEQAQAPGHLDLPCCHQVATLQTALSNAADQLARVRDDALRQTGGYALKNAIGKDFSCYEINRCGEVAAAIRKLLAAPEVKAEPSPPSSSGLTRGSADAPTPQAHISLGEDGEQFVRDAIRSAYDRGYNDARNAKSVLGDSALGYRGRDMSEEIAVDVLARLRRIPSAQPNGAGFQERVAAAHHALFHDDPTDIEERRNRFAEEVNETLQAFGMTEDEAIDLVRYSWSRPIGQPEKEVGAALLTLASLCVVAGIDMAACGEADLEKLQRPETIARIRAKRSTRHGRGPLPGFDPAIATEGKDNG